MMSTNYTRKFKRFTNEEKDTIYEEYKLGKSRVELSNKYGVSFESITNVLRGRGVQLIEHKSKLTDNQKESICREYTFDKSCNMSKLSRKYKVSRSTIKNILIDNNITIRNNPKSSLMRAKHKAWNRDGLVGEKFGKLTVIEYYDNDELGNSRWRCKCDCGNDTTAVGRRLKLGTKVSCGCFSKFPPGEGAFNHIYGRYKRNAKLRNLPFELTKDQVRELIGKNCFYCNAKPSSLGRKVGSKGCYVYNGIDRVDNNKGYTKDNCVPCCFICNRAKRESPINEFIEWLSNLSKNFNKRRLFQFLGKNNVSP